MYLDSVWQKRKQFIKDISWLDESDEFLEKIWQISWANHMRKKQLPYVKQRISIDLHRPVTLAISLRTLCRLISLHLLYWCINILNVEDSYDLSGNILIERTETNELFAKTPKFYSKVTKVIPLSIRECFKLNKNKYGRVKLVPGVTNFRLLRKYIVLLFLTRNSLRGMSYMHQELILQSFKFECAKLAFSRLLEDTKVVNVFLENDYGVPHTAISAVCRDHKIRTLHIAHGVFFDTNLEYFPVTTDFLISVMTRDQYNDQCSYISVQVPPLQLLPLKGDTSTCINEYNIGLFAKAGVLWHTEMLYSALKNVNWDKLMGGSRILLRHHPKANALVRRRLNEILPFENVDVSNLPSISDDIDRCELIVTFSMDSLIPLLYANKKIVYIVENERLDKYDHLLKEFSNLSIACDEETFESAITRLRELKGFDNKNKVAKVFGECELSEIDKILCNLC